MKVLKSGCSLPPEEGTDLSTVPVVGAAQCQVSCVRLGPCKSHLGETPQGTPASKEPAGDTDHLVPVSPSPAPEEPLLELLPDTWFAMAILGPLLGPQPGFSKVSPRRVGLCCCQALTLQTSSSDCCAWEQNTSQSAPFDGRSLVSLSSPELLTASHHTSCSRMSSQLQHVISPGNRLHPIAWGLKKPDQSCCICGQTNLLAPLATQFLDAPKPAVA
ncbi:uncharacterized protein [Manis javanica]|uniref:uncharacterized protein n=1 Tax=Manis javanica TaxID=9974 RepID=UPI000813BEA0